MKRKKSALDFDFELVVGARPLTEEDKRLISEFIKYRKQKAAKRKQRSTNKSSKKRA